MKKLLTITAPTCSGKSFLLDHLNTSNSFVKIPTFTTRPIRHGEVDGQDYFFVNDKQFSEIEGSIGGFLEKVVFGNYKYGMPYSFLEKFLFETDKIPVIICTPEGTEIYEQYCKAQKIMHIKAFVFTEEEIRLNRLMQRINNDIEKVGAKQSIYSGIQRCRDIFVNEIRWFSTNKWDVILSGTAKPEKNMQMILKKINILESKV